MYCLLFQPWRSSVRLQWEIECLSCEVMMNLHHGRILSSSVCLIWSFAVFCFLFCWVLFIVFRTKMGGMVCMPEKYPKCGVQLGRKIPKQLSVETCLLYLLWSLNSRRQLKSGKSMFLASKVIENADLHKTFLIAYIF